MNELKAKRLKWWQDARFGMFIHWGLYTVGGLDCYKMYDMGISLEEYIQRFERRFNGKRFNAHAFARVAKNGGCKYVVMVARHHEGYCLWDTKTTRFSSVQMTPKRDFIAEYVKAVRAAGLRVGLYYSLLDWRYKSYFEGPRKNPRGWQELVTLVHEQVRELMTCYGRIDILWYDGAQPVSCWQESAWKTNWGYRPSQDEVAEAWQSKKLNALVRRLQPGILINNRSCYPHGGEDFGTPEQQITPEQRPWELCDTMGDLWGAASQDLNRKTPREIITRIISCVSLGGNMLLNIGPKADGTVQEWQARIMGRIGIWMRKHGEAVHGCGAEWQEPFNHALAPWKTTRKGNTLYLHLLRYPGQEFAIANYHDYYLRSARLLDTGRRLKIIHEPARDIVKGLPRKAPDPIATVVKIAIRPKTPGEKKQSVGIGLEDPENGFCYDQD